MSYARLAIAGRIGPKDSHELCARVRGLLADAPELLVCDVGGLRSTDLDTVDALARVTLTARRLGCAVLLIDASADLRAVLDLAGLGAIVRCARRSSGSDGSGG